jgi:hypothetical protein
VSVASGSEHDFAREFRLVARQRNSMTTLGVLTATNQCEPDHKIAVL